MAQPVILIPVNRLDRAKGRLAAALTQAEREQLAIATLRTVWEAARAASEFVVVLTADARVGDILGESAEIVAESATLKGLNAQLEFGVLEALRMHTTGGEDAGDALPLLILHADLPLATPEAIRGLIDAASAPMSVAIVRSSDGGTNAMLQTSPARMALAYGPYSAAKHEANARAAGLAFAVHRSPELELDLDTPADLAVLLATQAGRDTRAGKALASMAVGNQLGAAP